MKQPKQIELVGLRLDHDEWSIRVAELMQFSINNGFRLKILYGIQGQDMALYAFIPQDQRDNLEQAGFVFNPSRTVFVYSTSDGVRRISVTDIEGDVEDGTLEVSHRIEAVDDSYRFVDSFSGEVFTLKQ